VSARLDLPAYGGRCVIHGRLRPPRTARNFIGFDERRYIAARGAVAVLEAEQVAMLPGGGGPAWRRRLVEPMRDGVLERLRATLAAREANLLAALVLGVRDGLDEPLEEGWRALGMSHVLALSGLHVGIVAGALLWIVRTPRRRSGFVVLLVGVGTYAALGGLGPSVLRAATMAAWMACAVHIGRLRSALIALAFAGALLALDAPQRVLDLRFQLSCLATLGILVWLPTLTGWSRSAPARAPARLLRHAMGVCGLGLSAQAATLPVVVNQFGFLSWASPLTNLTLVPVVSFALLLALAGLPIQFVAESLGRPLWLVAAGMLHTVLRITDQVPGRCDPRLFVPASPFDLTAAWLLCAATLAAGACAARGWRGASRGTLAAALVCACALGLRAARPRQPAWELVALDVGQGDALLVRVEARAWLLDCGNDRPVDAGARTIVPHLRRAGVRRLRGLLLTHPHRDHFGGAASVLATIPVDTVYVAHASLNAPAYAAMRAAASAVPWRGLVAGDRLWLAPKVPAEVLWPPASDVLGSGANDVSLVLWARGPGMPDLLAMGDLEADGEALLLRSARAALQARAASYLVLKVGHHGSRTSSTPGLLDAADAELALISVGLGNRYGHPADATLAALRARGCIVVRTDRGGAARLLQRGHTLWLERPAEAPRALRLDAGWE
jgi:competence protein ComEC